MEAVDAYKAVNQVSLGYAGGAMDGSDDNDPFVCKLGGRPAWLDSSSPLPDHASVVCEQCGSDMVMLVQTYVPLSDSPYDRVLYVWACNQRACTGKHGAARATRAHLLNKEYALKLVKRNKLLVAKRQLESDGATTLAAPRSSLFPQPGSGAPKLDFGSVWRSSESSVSATGRAGLFTGPIFGVKDAATSECRPSSETCETTLAASAQLEKLSSRLDTLKISQNTLVEPGSDEILARVEWPQSAASLPPQYLEFDKEHLSKDCISERYHVEIEQALEAAYGDGGGKGKGKGKKPAEASNEWADEKYERAARPKGTDAAFERFSRVASQNPEQVLRYQFGGRPLLYSMQDSTARQLLGPTTKSQPIGSIHNTSYHSDEDDDSEDDDDENNNDIGMRGYSTEALPKCPHCKGKRVFECQLMPALLTVLPLSSHVTAAPNQAPSAVLSSTERLVGERLLQTLDLGIEFGSLLVFTCENDCHGGQIGTDHLGQCTRSMSMHACAAYFEELVLVQLEC
ncbi:hypothetical protein GGI20_004631 [Coemansia sp. BCRC 34301]|nr:hypothetical protein GGI20_004631 [Coemansia sp. BCRC 34301]